MRLKNYPQIEIVSIEKIKPNPNQTQTFTDEHIRLMAGHLQRQPVFPPIITDDDHVIAFGENRYLAAKQAGFTEVPLLRTRFIDDHQRRAFALAEAKFASMAEWNEEALQSELEALFDAGLELTEIGFSAADLDFGLVADADTSAPSEVEQVELPDLKADAVTRAGDLWLIGPHRLLCGDARDSTCWDALLANDRADIVFADGPYNVKVNGHVSGTGRHREFAHASGELSPPQFTHFQRSVFKHSVRYSRSGSIHYQCMDWRHAREILDAADGVYAEFKQLIVWNKGSGGLGAFYRSQHELIFVFKSGKAKHVNNFGLGETGRYRTNVVDYAGCNTFRKGRKEDLEAHSTVKPTALVVDFLLDCSNRGDLVVDPFIGSGTTLIAAHKAKRRGAGIEIDPLYVDTALKRLKAASGIEPVLDGDGRSFSEIAAERLSQGQED